MLNDSTLKADLLELVTVRRYVTFAEIGRFLAGRVEGNITLHHPASPNLIIWEELNETIINAISELMQGKRIMMYPCQVSTYITDGARLRLPVARHKAQYKRPHWLPMYLDIVEPRPGRRPSPARRADMVIIENNTKGPSQPMQHPPTNSHNYKVIIEAMVKAGQIPAEAPAGSANLVNVAHRATRRLCESGANTAGGITSTAAALVNTQRGTEWPTVGAMIHPISKPATFCELWAHGMMNTSQPPTAARGLNSDRRRLPHTTKGGRKQSN